MLNFFNTIPGRRGHPSGSRHGFEIVFCDRSRCPWQVSAPENRWYHAVPNCLPQTCGSPANPLGPSLCSGWHCSQHRRTLKIMPFRLRFMHGTASQSNLMVSYQPQYRFAVPFFYSFIYRGFPVLSSLWSCPPPLGQFFLFLCSLFKQIVFFGY